MNLREEFNEHGWVLLENFYSEKEIAEINRGVQESIAKNIKADLLCNPYLADSTILNPKIVGVVKELLGDSPTYIGDSSISFDNLEMSLHKDNPDRLSGTAPDWQSPYDILRMGIYLQDYDSHSGGLILRDRSHNYISRWKGKIVNVRTRPGDLVIWNLRTTHSGNARRYKMFPHWDINPYVNKYLPSFLFKPTHSHRAALFLSYGKDGSHLERYINYLKTRSYAVDRWRDMVITDEMRKKAEKIGLKLRDLSDEARKLQDSAVHEGHQEIKY